MNASSSLTLSKDEMQTFRNALRHSGGSFKKLFSIGEGEQNSAVQ
jgi:hypothetical protein